MRITVSMTTRSGPATAIVAVGVLTAAVLASCSSSGHSGGNARQSMPSTSLSSPGPALASTALGALIITGGYVPQPASPDVAAAYLTITNNGATADRLVKVTSSVTSTVMPMNENDSNGVGSMTDLTSITIPAHGSMQFTPDHAHFMLEKPKPLEAGDEVTLTLTFAHAGTVDVTLPVVPLGEAPAGSSATPITGSMSGMPGMAGKTMPSG